MSGVSETGDDLAEELLSAAQSRESDALHPLAGPPSPTPQTAPEPLPVAPARPQAPANGPVLPAVAERGDGTYGTVAALSMRMESLASAVNAVSSTFASHLGEYGEMVARVHRTQVETVDEYRHGIDRSLAELR